jgi:hypothetical protein
MTSAGTDPRGQTSPERMEALEAQVRDLARELAETSQRVAGLETELRVQIDGSGPRFATLYADFTDRFRGPTVEVTAKLADYLPDVRRLIGAAARAGAAGPTRRPGRRPRTPSRRVKSRSAVRA